MAQKEKRKVQEKRATVASVGVRGGGSYLGDFTPPYLRGVRDALAVVRGHLELQFGDYRPIADKLGIPYFAVMLMIEGNGTPVQITDIDVFNGWLDLHELSREEVLGVEG